MEFLKALVQIVYIGICIVLTVLVLKQEGKASLGGALTGSTETYWSKNKGRSKEGWLERSTKILAAAFIVLAIVLNLNW